MAEEAVQLEMLHRHWKVLKLAGVYAVIDERNSISSQDIIEAISFAESLNGHLARFIELSKREHYEQLIDLLKIEDSISIHGLRKRELITAKGNPNNQVEALLRLGNSSLGKEGMLKFDEDLITLELFKEINHGASYKMVSGTKEERSYKVHDNFIYKKSDFSNLSKLLCNDTSYVAFEFTDGKRSNDSICSGATFAILDVDDSDITWTEAHDMLQDYTHHVAMTSDDTNPYKFRVMIELDIEVNIDARLWKLFMGRVGKHLGLELDLLAQSQQYYGFKGREVLSTLDGEALPASEFVKNLDVVTAPIKRLTQANLSKVLDDAFDTFSYAYEVSGNTGASSMYRAFKHAKDLGASQEQVIHLLKDICEYRDTDFDEIMKRTGMLNQIERSYLV